jgi:hypothetical protein
MTMDGTDEEIRRVCSILESIAKNYPADSDEAVAVRDAASAYIPVQQHQALTKRYRQLVLAAGGQLTDEMKHDLRRHGIEPDNFDDDNNA